MVDSSAFDLDMLDYNLQVNNLPAVVVDNFDRVAEVDTVTVLEIVVDSGLKLKQK